MTEIAGRYVEVDGCRTYYEACGSGPPVLLLHTAGRDNRQWHGVMERLAGRFNLFAPDLPGHGKSWPLGDGWGCLEDAHDIVRWLRHFMDAVCGRPFAVVGCSLGGNLSLLMGALDRDLLAVVALQGADHTPSFSEAALDLMVHPQNNLMFSNMDFTMSLVGGQAAPEGRRLVEWGILTINAPAQRADLRAYARCDTRALMGDVACPVLLVHGSEDWVVSEDMVTATRERLVNAGRVEFVSLPGLGHFPHVEAPDRIADLVARFLGTVEAR